MSICAAPLVSPNPSKSPKELNLEKEVWLGHDGNRGLAAAVTLQHLIPRLRQSNLIIISIGTMLPTKHSKCFFRSMLSVHPQMTFVRQKWARNMKFPNLGTWDTSAYGTWGKPWRCWDQRPGPWSLHWVLLCLTHSASLLAMKGKRFERIFLVTQEMERKPSALLCIEMFKNWIISDESAS